MISNGFKLAGKENYPWCAYSPNDISKLALGFKSKRDADQHANQMNNLIDTYPGGLWSADHWKVIPERWIVEEV